MPLSEFIYEDLSRDDLLERYLCGHTQNANESFNATIWGICAKRLNSGLKILEISAFIAAGIFNEGYTRILKFMNELDIIVGTYCKVFAENSDEARIVKQNRMMSLSETKAALTAGKQQQVEDN